MNILLQDKKCFYCQTKMKQRVGGGTDNHYYCKKGCIKAWYHNGKCEGFRIVFEEDLGIRVYDRYSKIEVCERNEDTSAHCYMRIDEFDIFQYPTLEELKRKIKMYLIFS